MTIFKPFVGLIVIFIFIMSISAPITSCKKTDTVYDTTYKTIVDTIVVKDTVYDVTTGLVAYYNFINGNLNDSSGYNNNIAFSNATKTNDRFGNPNGAYLFNGSSSYMTVKNSSSLNPSIITIFAIVKVNGFYAGYCDGNQVISKGYPYQVNGFYGMEFFDYSSGCVTIDSANETFSGYYGDSYSGLAADSVKIKKGQWYNLAYTYDGTTENFYINGYLKATLTHSDIFTPNTYDLFIGKHENPSYPYYLNGVIDELRIYDRVLSAPVILKMNDLKE